jgi:hypothetical protein
LPGLSLPIEARPQTKQASLNNLCISIFLLHK